MNDLLKGSSEFSRDRSNRSDIESAHGPGNSGDLGLAGFFKKVGEIDNQYEKLDKHLKKLQAAHEETKAVTKGPAMKSIKQRMERDVDEVGRISRFIKGKIEELDREGSSEFSRDRSNRSDIESAHGPGNSGDLGLAGFFKKVGEIDNQYEKLDKHLKKLQAAHEETKAVTKGPAMKCKFKT
ncbi:hypothetical protein F2Q68_00033240 [Brassica cretica]|uniref:Syntaxin N-terminal domain-containing protein n=1 Tax=Brassica cretica TaxID=69181 RepID=A0A8S9G956_BRACR|nr:hypothetical protein F2Q68_00033240 [Brassica cretica]